MRSNHKFLFHPDDLPGYIVNIPEQWTFLPKDGKFLNRDSLFLFSRKPALPDQNIQAGEGLMKRLFMVLLIVVVAVGSGYLIYRALIPKSDKLNEQYQAFMTTIDQTSYRTSARYRWEVDDKIRRWQFDLASAYNADKRPDEAIILLEGLIAAMNKQQYALDKKIPRNSGQVEWVAIYYAGLADSYRLKHDEEKTAWALQKSEEYRAEAARLATRQANKT
jgi:hypothetical protein